MARAYNPSYSGGRVRRIAESRRRRLQWAKIVPLHSSLGNKSETPSQKKKIKLAVLERKKDFQLIFSYGSTVKQQWPTKEKD